MGCPLDISTIYAIQNMTCTGEACANMVVRNDDGGPENVYYETSNCGECYSLDLYGNVTKCTEQPECNLVAINHHAACGGGYTIAYSRIRLDDTVYGENSSYFDSPQFSKEDLANSTHIAQQIKDVTLEFDLVPTGEIIEPTPKPIPSSIDYRIIAAGVVIAVLCVLIAIYLFKKKIIAPR